MQLVNGGRCYKTTYDGWRVLKVLQKPRPDAHPPLCLGIRQQEICLTITALQQAPQQPPRHHVHSLCRWQSRYAIRSCTQEDMTSLSILISWLASHDSFNLSFYCMTLTSKTLGGFERGPAPPRCTFRATAGSATLRAPNALVPRGRARPLHPLTPPPVCVVSSSPKWPC